MIYGVPLPVFWTVGGIAVVLGLLMIVRTDKTVRTMRRWLLRQLRWVRTPGYRRYVKLNGWALFVHGPWGEFDLREERGRFVPRKQARGNEPLELFVVAVQEPADTLTEYYRLTGIPSVINTSFNMHEEPIVCTPEDAIRAFLQGNLDYLAIGDFLVEHPGHRQ